MTSIESCGMSLVSWYRKIHNGGNMGKSLLITLPRAWVVSNALQKGDSVLVCLSSDGTLRVSRPDAGKPAE
jgi:antitoxin component of MazEF toxin-antitoxin module